MAGITVLFVVFFYAMYTKTTEQQKITADYIVQRYRWKIYQKKIKIKIKQKLTEKIRKNWTRHIVKINY